MRRIVFLICSLALMVIVVLFAAHAFTPNEARPPVTQRVKGPTLVSGELIAPQSELSTLSLGTTPLDVPSAAKEMILHRNGRSASVPHDLVCQITK